MWLPGHARIKGNENKDLKSQLVEHIHVTKRNDWETYNPATKQSIPRVNKSFTHQQSSAVKQNFVPV